MYQKILNFLVFAVCLVFSHQAFALEMPDLNYNGVPVRMMPSSSLEIDPSVLAQKGRISKISEPGYEVVLGCRSLVGSPDFTEVKYEILRLYDVPQEDLTFFKLNGSSFEMLGQILVQWEPGCIRIRNIFMEPAHRGKKYGSQALEILLRDLMERGVQKTSSFVLEVSFHKTNLITWYKSFGFVAVNEDSGIVEMCIAPREKVKFPYWKQMKAKKKAVEAKK